LFYFFSLLSEGSIRSGELDAIEIRALASFEPTVAVEIIDAFKKSLATKRVGNKSGHLAGLIKQYTSKKPTNNVATSSVNSSSNDELNGTVKEVLGLAAAQESVSRRERKKLESLEIARIMEEEGILEEVTNYNN
jgi:hypothetical protein